MTRDAVWAESPSAQARQSDSIARITLKRPSIGSSGCGMRVTALLVGIVLLCAAIDEIADEAKQREGDHRDNADDER